MKRIFNITSGLVLFLSGTGASFSRANENPVQRVKYKIQKDDQIGKLLDQIGVCPLWGPKGHAELVQKENPILKKYSFDKIRPGIIVQLPVPKVSSPEWKITAENELQFLVKHPTPKCPGGNRKLASQERVAPPPQYDEPTQPVQEEIKVTEPLVAAPAVNDKPIEQVKVVEELKPFEANKPEVVIHPIKAPKVIEPVQQSEIKNAPAEDDGQFGIFEISPIFGFTKLQAKDFVNGGNAVLNSNLNYGLGIRYNQIFSDEFKTYFSYTGTHIDFLTPKTRTHSNPKSIFSETGVGFSYRLSPRVFVDPRFVYSQRPYIRSTSTTNLTTDKISVPMAIISLGTDIYQSKRFVVSLSGEYTRLFETATDNQVAKEGGGYGGRLDIEQKLKSMKMRSGVYYKYQKQNSNIVEQKQTDIGITFGFGIILD